MFLSRKQIQLAQEAGDLVISPFSEQMLKPASYTLTLGNVLIDAVTGEEIGITAQGFVL